MKLQKRSYHSSFSLVFWATCMSVNETGQDPFSELEGKRQSTAKCTEINPLLPNPYLPKQTKPGASWPRCMRVHTKEAPLIQSWGKACQCLYHSCLLGRTSYGQCVREPREFSCLKHAARETRKAKCFKRKSSWCNWNYGKYLSRWKIMNFTGMCEDTNAHS